MKLISSAPCVGYIEGYYGCLPSWQMRSAMLQRLQRHAMTSYFYAPKEDPQHRLHWREPYSMQWRVEFKRWCELGQSLSINIIAGIAPGLDFNFTHLNGGKDLDALFSKAQQLLDDGATAIALLMDDINTQFNPTNNGFQFEGQAHAVLANALSERLGCALYVVPRVYAKELEHESAGYAEQFVQHLQQTHVVFHCGTHIVAQEITPDHFSDYSKAGHRVVAWDNLYANDYCPRRFFVGPWLGRSATSDIMLNPTGLSATDAMLIDMMANTIATGDALLAYDTVLREHGVPEQFQAVARYFFHPPYTQPVPEETQALPSLEEQLVALEFLLWKWKTPLSREWYPCLYGLKHDLLIANGRAPELRIRKTQLAPLAELLTRSNTQTSK